MHSECTEVKIFLRRAALFAAPFVILLGIPALVLWRGGEFVPLESVIAKQSKDPAVVYGVAYSDMTPYYKLRTAQVRYPTILALGPSTVLQFSSRLFNVQEDFYNAGGAVGAVEDYATFMDMLGEDAQPTIVLFGLQQRYFKLGKEHSDGWDLAARVSAEEKFFSKWHTVWRDLWSGKIPINSIVTTYPNAVGLSAMLRGDGFLRDGSYTWGSYVAKERAGTLTTSQEARRLSDRAEFEQTGFGYSGGGTEHNEEAIKILDATLAKWHARGIYVVGFLPPSFGHEIYTRLQDPQFDAKYFFTLAKKLAPTFKKYGYPLFDFSNLESIGASDAELYDANHATRKAYARLLIAMAKADPILRKEVDVPHLDAAIREATSTLDIF